MNAFVKPDTISQIKHKFNKLSNKPAKKQSFAIRDFF